MVRLCYGTREYWYIFKDAIGIDARISNGVAHKTRDFQPQTISIIIDERIGAESMASLNISSRAKQCESSQTQINHHIPSLLYHWLCLSDARKTYNNRYADTAQVDYFCGCRRARKSLNRWHLQRFNCSVEYHVPLVRIYDFYQRARRLVLCFVTGRV